MGGNNEREKEKEKERKIEIIKEEEHIRKTFSAYQNIKNFLVEYIYGPNKIASENTLQVYLISTRSIPIFINILNEQFEDPITNEEELKKVENKLKEKLIKYEIEKNVIIYDSYQQCLNAMENIKDNEFFIVSEDFLNNFEIKNSSSKYITIINLDKYNHSMTLEFSASGKKIIAEEKRNKKGYFQFKELTIIESKIESQIENKNQEGINALNERKEKINYGYNINYSSLNEESSNLFYLNQPSDILNKDKKNKKDEIYYSSIESILYCLLNIKSLNDEFNNINIKQDKIISKMLYDMIKQKQNKNIYYNYSNFADLIKSYYYFEPDIGIENIYKILHDELKVIDPNQNSIIINQDINSPNPQIELINASNKFYKDGISIISKIFYFQNLITFWCNNCNRIISYKSYINNHFIFYIKDIYNSLNGKNSINIYDCFEYLTSNKKENIICKNCSYNRINSTYSNYRIDSTKEILTIILDRGKDFIDNEIFFSIDFNLDLAKYFFNPNKQQNYVLIGFCSYYKADNKCIPLYKNYEDNKWYYLKNSKINIVPDNLDCGSPFLLFYKHIFK